MHAIPTIRESKVENVLVTNYADPVSVRYIYISVGVLHNKYVVSPKILGEGMRKDLSSRVSF